MCTAVATELDSLLLRVTRDLNATHDAVDRRQDGTHQTPLKWEEPDAPANYLPTQLWEHGDSCRSKSCIDGSISWNRFSDVPG